MTQILTKEKFIEKSNLKHGKGVYDYSLVDYRGCKSVIKILCNKHGVFEQKAYKHISGQGCPKCAGRILQNEDFENKAKEIHQNTYDYSLVKYESPFIKVCIICSIHGEFWQTPRDHLNKCGCPYCFGKIKLNNRTFTNRANEVHNNKYDYSKVDYKDIFTEVCIICPEHGEFWQKPNNHLNAKSGCPKCNSSKGELQVENWLNKNNIKFIPQKRFGDCRNKQPLPFDFYLPELNTCIEYDGIQHFEPIYGKKNLEQTQINDLIKNKFCKDHRITLIRINFKENISNKLEEYLC